MKRYAALAAGVALVAHAIFPSAGMAGTSYPLSASPAGCASGSLQLVIQNRSKWLLALVNTSDAALMPPAFIRPGEGGVWCMSAGDATGEVAYSVNANSGSIIHYSIAGGAVSSISVLPEGGPPTAYCAISQGSSAGQPGVILTYSDGKPDASATVGVCTLMQAGSSEAQTPASPIGARPYTAPT
jgi:hypothetical protein